MDNIKKGLSIQFGKAFALYLAIEFEDRGEFYKVSAKKLNFSIESYTKNINEAQDEFAEALVMLISIYRV